MNPEDVFSPTKNPAMGESKQAAGGHQCINVRGGDVGDDRKVYIEVEGGPRSGNDNLAGSTMRSALSKLTWMQIRPVNVSVSVLHHNRSAAPISYHPTRSSPPSSKRIAGLPSTYHKENGIEIPEACSQNRRALGYFFTKLSPQKRLDLILIRVHYAPLAEINLTRKECHEERRQYTPQHRPP